MQTKWIPDNSALAAFRESPELFRLKYRHHLQPASPNDKMTAGSAIHAGRNVLYNFKASAPRGLAAVYPPEVIDAAVAVARAHRGEGSGHRSADQCETIVRTYAAKYAVEPFHVVENERYVEARIVCEMCKASAVSSLGAMTLPDADCALGYPCGCFYFCGIIDAVGQFPDESRYAMDLKSTGAYLNESWETMVRLGDQFVGYVAMERANGRRCDGFFVDGIHVRDAKPRKDGSLGVPSVGEDDFVRVGPVSVPEWRIERWAQDVRYTLRQIAELEETRGLDAPWPIYQNWPYGKVDAYREFYETPAELHHEVRNMFEVREWSPREVAEQRKVTP